MNITLTLILLFLGLSNFLLWGGLLIAYMWHTQDDEEINKLISKHRHLRKEVNENMCEIYNQKLAQKELHEMYSNLNSRINEEKLKGMYKK